MDQPSVTPIPLKPVIRHLRWPLASCLALALQYAIAADHPVLELPKTGLEAQEIGLIVNEDDPLSLRIADYYQQHRHIPDENILRVRFPPNSASLSRGTFKPLRESVLSRSGPKIQAYAIAWTLPYRVDCMSITSAFALGFDEAYCSARQCAGTKSSGYFNSNSHAPYSDLHIRPTMLLAGQNFEAVKRLIDRGIASDHTYPTHTGFLLNTSDKSRSVRNVFFDPTVKALGEAFKIEKLDADSIKNKPDVLFYFTGIIRVDNLASLGFVPGAIADHLTSAGGVLESDGQMSSLRWLEAGATGSYGAVVEPCNHLQKFPVPPVAMWHYAEGDSLIEAYWKSVAWPGEGVFIGEPLAKPFAPRLSNIGKDKASLEIFSPNKRGLFLEAAPSAIGPYRRVNAYLLNPGANRIEIRLPKPELNYRLRF